VKACICFSVTHRELAESRQNAGICWFRAPRHYSASLLVVRRALRSVLSSCHASAWHDDDYRYMRATVGNRSIAATPFLVAIEQPKPPCTQGLSTRQSQKRDRDRRRLANSRRYHRPRPMTLPRSGRLCTCARLRYRVRRRICLLSKRRIRKQS